MKLATTLLSIALLLPGTVFAQDKSKEAVGSVSKTVIKTNKTMTGQPLGFPTEKPEITMVHLTMEPDGHSSVHRHVGNLATGYVLDGMIEVRTEGKATKVNAGESFVEPSGEDQWVQLWNTHTGVSKVLVFITGSEGVPVSAPMK